MVALAILMPIVASMGGNAGTQSMTVAVRALATKDIDSYNTFRTIRREFLVGMLNGLFFAILIGAVAAWWFANFNLGIIIGIAMIINMICAALSGILIPIGLDRIKRFCNNRYRCRGLFCIPWNGSLVVCDLKCSSLNNLLAFALKSMQFLALIDFYVNHFAYMYGMLE